jgi:hypothetical protein
MSIAARTLTIQYAPIGKATAPVKDVSRNYPGSVNGKKKIQTVYGTVTKDSDGKLVGTKAMTVLESRSLGNTDCQWCMDGGVTWASTSLFPLAAGQKAAGAQKPIGGIGYASASAPNTAARHKGKSTASVWVADAGKNTPFPVERPTVAVSGNTAVVNWL